MIQSSKIHPAALAAATAALQPYIPELSPSSLVDALKRYKPDVPATAAAPVKPMTRQEAAEFLNVSVGTIVNYMKEGRLKATRMGKRLVRIDPASVEALAGCSTVEGRDE